MDARERDGDTDRAYPTARTCPMFPRLRRRALQRLVDRPHLGILLPKQDRIIDDAYNKYARDDDEDLPEWFLEDERQFMRPPPVYGAEGFGRGRAGAWRPWIRRSIKKVAEAKSGCKKKRPRREMAQARKRASTIMEQDDVPDVSKAREIEKIYAKAKARSRTRQNVKRRSTWWRGNSTRGPPEDRRWISACSPIDEGCSRRRVARRRADAADAAGAADAAARDKGGGGGRGRGRFK